MPSKFQGPALQIERDLPSPPRLPSGRTSVTGWIDRMLAHGLHSFTTEEAHRVLGGALARVRLGLSRLAAKGRLIRPAKGLYVIVSPEHQMIGAPPPVWYIDATMRHLGLPYYVGLLSAAALHGASQQAPQELQVVTAEPRPVKVLGRGRIRWIAKRRLAESATEIMSTPTGPVVVATPETTAVDLVHYASRAGYLDHVAAVLADLAERLNAKLLTTAALSDQATARRLGYLLGAVGHHTLATAFHTQLALPSVRVLALDPTQSADDAPIDPMWRVLINTTIDPT